MSAGKGKSVPIKTEFAWDLLAKMFALVWWKLPADARQVLESRLFLVSDSERWREPGHDATHINGSVQEVPGKGFVVYLNKINLIHCTEGRIEKVIAHELAHVYLNHAGLPVINSKVTEPQADAQTLAWGFGSRSQEETYRSEVRRMRVKAGW